MGGSPDLAGDPLRRPGLVEVSEQLQGHGFVRRREDLFTMPLGDDFMGWLGLPRATQGRARGQLAVLPIAGIRSQQVERLVAELAGRKYHAYTPPTVSSPLGHVPPSNQYLSWEFGVEGFEAAAADLVSKVVELALPFYASGADLPGLCRLLDAGVGHPHQIAYSRPVAWMLRGERDHALHLIEDSVEALGARSDLAAEALRGFAEAFRHRYGSAGA